MNTLRDILADAVNNTDLAIGAPAAGERVYTYEQLAETSRSLATVFAEAGIDADSVVAIAPAPAAETVIGFLSATALGAQVRFSPPARAAIAGVFGPTETVAAFQVPDDALRVGFGERPDADRITHFGTAVWKADADPIDAPVVPTTPALSDGSHQYTHRALLQAANAVIDARDITTETEIAVRGPLTDPRTIVAGFIAPLVAGGTIRFPSDGTPHGDLAITDDEAPEHRLLLLLDVPLAGY